MRSDAPTEVLSRSAALRHRRTPMLPTGRLDGGDGADNAHLTRRAAATTARAGHKGTAALPRDRRE